MQKMPYKHIAAHLKKTELACRLHYHQMSYGSNGRRRADSISSTTSFNSVATTRELPDNSHYTQLSPVSSPPRTPELSSQRLNSGDTTSMCQLRAPVPILPKPDTHQITLPRLDTSFTPSKPPSTFNIENSMCFDYSRVRALYDAHRESFWAMIAAEYSHEYCISGNAIEQAFFRSISLGLVRSQSPPTPRPSPGASPEPHSRSYSESSPMNFSYGFQAVNKSTSTPSHSQYERTPSSADRCSVSALLTVEKEVRPSKGVDCSL
ncbi:hypothetical protein BGW36DRAFT_127894 [Talaromyces proteolyticus]|uniref:Uncharacterized protein n=1 Tax=Talaromyces proteolyticus TaxID=1131652 RepID=A0AAD4Q2G4_9EURO|nr:uncharacterized protein BGW36DRAFT_127894 [Talaromyces proteolyticus]KAH8700356.1 hypothetical protein BGW36DRAFT_127894 [Talaromyces proteolyticus]